MACAINNTTTVKDAVSKLMGLFLKPKFETDSECWVHITHTNDPHLFYIRPIEYKEFLTVIEEPTSQPSDHINIGMIFIYKSQLLNKWVRGRVLSINNDILNMFAVDYGCLEGVNINLITCKHSEDNIPGLASKAELGHSYPVDGRQFSKEAIDCFKYFTKGGAGEVKVLNKIGEKIVVELTIGGPPDVSTMLALAGHICFMPVSTSRPVSKDIKMFKKQTLNVGDVKHVRVLLVRSILNFFVADHKDYAAYSTLKNKLRTEMPNHKSILKLDLLKPGAAVIVYSKALHYERGQVLHITIPPRTFKVLLVDTGIIFEVPGKCLKEIPDSFLELPPLAIQCISLNIDKNVLQVGKEFTIRIVGVPDKYSVRTKIELVE